MSSTKKKKKISVYLCMKPTPGREVFKIEMEAIRERFVYADYPSTKRIIIQQAICLVNAVTQAKTITIPMSEVMRDWIRLTW